MKRHFEESIQTLGFQKRFRSSGTLHRPEYGMSESESEDNQDAVDLDLDDIMKIAEQFINYLIDCEIRKTVYEDYKAIRIKEILNKNAIKPEKQVTKAESAAPLIIVCPHCQKKIAPMRFVTHLEKCMGINRRVSARPSTLRYHDATLSGT